MKRIHMTAAVGLAAALLVGAPLAAQDVTATPNAAAGMGDAQGQTGQVTAPTLCDSTLVLLAGLASRYFGYQPPAEINLSSFEYGQYAALFAVGGMAPDAIAGQAADAQASQDAAQQSSGQGAATDAVSEQTGGQTDASVTAEQTPEATVVADSNVSAADANNTGSSVLPATVYLQMPMLANEDPTCTQLRGSLENFFGGALGTADWDMRFRQGLGGMTGGQ